MQLFIHSVPTTKLICNQFTVDALEQYCRSEAAHIPHTTSVHEVLNSKRCNRGLQMVFSKISYEKALCHRENMGIFRWVSRCAHALWWIAVLLRLKQKKLRAQTLNIHKHYSFFLLSVLMQYYSPSTDGNPTISSPNYLYFQETKNQLRKEE